MLINVYLWKSEKAKQTRVALIVRKYILELIKYSGCFVYTGKCLREEKTITLWINQRENAILENFFWELEEYQHYIE